ncbi:hypothetical protein QBC46DRAFT_377107 [Diplogelasinospora grovesii]|uniref:Uncharacterized protein n=1 Tax=Diplogelasinospora grovesii TaxID=303347 RepID=A0AAN6NCX4_9PEZI|nr:hypothetical protein QBC46DRAFT_377107 [Diplogelasinospora grovesii]
MASTSAVIPRFLLPQNGPMWQRQLLRGVGDASRAGSRRRVELRFASTTTPPPPKTTRFKTPVLEKPERFNPPSHGSKLPSKGSTLGRTYGGDLSASEVQAQKQRDYPGMMAPEGTWGHWIWNSRGIHLFITLGTLGGLAAWTFSVNFQRNSPFADMVPSLSDFMYHPINSTRALADVIRLDSAHNAAIVEEKRRRRVDDVAKRNEYRKAHGLDQEQGFMAWRAKTDAESLGPALPTTTPVPTADGGSEGDSNNTAVTAVGAAEGPRKKWLGIF